MTHETIVNAHHSSSERQTDPNFPISFLSSLQNMLQIGEYAMYLPSSTSQLM